MTRCIARRLTKEATMIGMLWFLFGILATIGTEFAALMGAANAA